MALNAANIKNNNGNKERVEQPVVEPGMYPARIVQIIDIGLQAQRSYEGQAKPPANEIMISYEFADVFMVDKDGNEVEDKPRWISEAIPLYSIQQEKAKSTQRYNAADPDGVYGGDFSKLAGAPVNISVVHKKKGDKTYVNIGAVAPMRKRDADKIPDLANDPKVFDLDAPDMEIFGSLPQWVQDKIKSNLNFNGSKLQELLGGKPVEEPAPKEEPVVNEEEGDDTPW